MCTRSMRISMVAFAALFSLLGSLFSTPISFIARAAPTATELELLGLLPDSARVNAMAKPPASALRSERSVAFIVTSPAATMSVNGDFDLRTCARTLLVTRFMATEPAAAAD